MSRRTMTIIVTAITSLTLLFAPGCENDSQTGAMIGGLAGAGIGQLAGRSTEATLIGAAIGTGAGYFIGNESDKKKTRAEMDAIRYEMNTVTVHVTNTNGSIIAVKLSKSGPGFIGPKGEYYPTLPTEDQLRPVYGF